MTASISDVRRFWDRRPCNVRHSPEPVGSLEYFREVATRRYTVEPHIVGFADFPSWRGRRVLDLGCGIGTDSAEFAKAGAHVTAVDLSPESVRITKHRFRLLGLRGNVLEANVEQLSEFIAPRPYDLVYSFGVLHHTPRPSSALWEVENLFSKRGTTLKAMLYHRRSLKVLGVLFRSNPLLWFRGVDELVAKVSEAQHGCPITRTYTRRAARELVEAHGFRVTDLRVRHIFPYRVDDYVRHRLVKAFPYSVIPDSAVRQLARVLGWHLLVTAVRVA